MNNSPEDLEIMGYLRSTMYVRDMYRIDDKIYVFSGNYPQNISAIVTCCDNGEYIIDKNPTFVLDETTQPIANVDILNRLKLDLPTLTFNAHYMTHGNVAINIPQYEEIDLDLVLSMGEIVANGAGYSYNEFVDYLVECGSQLSSES